MWREKWDVSLIASLLRHNLVYISGIIILTLRSRPRCQPATKVFHHAGKFHQVRNQQESAPVARENFWINADKISPLRGKRPYGAIVGLQQQPFALQVTSLTNAGQLPSEKGMKWVRDPHKLLICAGRGCILR
ncbi:hypothetical protein LPU83_pLPU83b_0137 (plasmid) [Rhizobium favelukesii]|uniref:Uncharacterized protein n=1 Tax=Rhizobium favelukesii TaxID=348824 RepID=W6RMG4_9HYPH|nr:hypothetical protein LPU83_pLPU83b_0137 [Rhizobium favelukesii]